MKQMYKAADLLKINKINWVPLKISSQIKSSNLKFQEDHIGSY